MQGSTSQTAALKCARHFSAAVRNKGQSYFRGGRVSLHGKDDGIIDAQVRGSGGNYYDVRIDAEAPHNGLFVACSCPHFDDGNLCKHIWATLLAADDNGLLPGLVGVKNVEVIDDYDLLDGASDGDDFFDDEDDPFINPFTGRSMKGVVRKIAHFAKPKKQQLKPRIANWQRALQTISAPQQSAHPLDASTQRERRVLYMLDLTATLATGHLIIELMQQEKRKDGQWGKIKPLPTHRQEPNAMEDQLLIDSLLGNRVGSRMYYDDFLWNDDDVADNCVGLMPVSYPILPRLCETGRFSWALSRDAPEDAHPIAWDDGPPWRLRMRLTPNDKQKQWLVTGEIYRDKQAHSLSHIVATAPSLVLFSDRLARLDFETDLRWFNLLRAEEPIAVPYADRRQFLESLWEGVPPEVVWPENLQPEIKVATPHGRLRVHKRKEEKWSHQTNRSTLYADAEFVYGDKPIPLDDHRSGMISDDGARVFVRDEARELELLEDLRQLTIRPNGTQLYMRQPGNVQFPLKRLDEVVSTLVAKGWQVEAEGVKVRTAGKFSLSVHASGVDWFELESQIDFGGEVATLPKLLAAVRAGENYVKLDDGSRGMLPSGWLARFAPLADLAEQKDGKLCFKPAQSLLLDALLSEKNADMQVELDRQFQQFRRKLQKFSGIQPKKAPRTFQGELRPYQENGLGWLNFLHEFGLGGCLADDMGLGKTIQVLAWLLARRQSSKEAEPTLIVVPKSLVFNWIEEAQRFAPKLRTLNYTGLDRNERAADFTDADVVLTTYGTLRRDIAKLKDQRFDCVILDEAQAIKNDSSQTAKACRVLNADLRLALTGTPIENHLGELWSLFEFLNPGMLGRSAAFRAYCQQADEKPEVRELLQRGLAPFILRRTKQQVLKELPEKTEQTIHCELSAAERKKYNELRDYYRASLQKRIDTSGIKKSKMHVLEALLRLRQTACHPGLLDKKLASKSSAKLDMLLEQIAEVTQEGHKALVFSQFTTLLSIVKDQLDKQGIVYEYLDGRTRNRQEKVDRFQTDAACPLFLISLKAGGCGLNLTAADYVFLLDPWWNPAVEAQAIDRTHRIGQTRNVFAYRLIAQNTVEEKILELQQQKRDLADAIITSNTNVLAKLTTEDLQVLLS